ncbi:CidA/LrgA family protein [Ureibacillus acetophenoni]|uniref:Holin-like protein n=1 Tax=Ureibacillus acetophenoni TaxID=614649 RepID=A0A285U1E9_9BACL|nr:CidA/LrgA family protein [Ureibacillus acetophenoni]SOC35238.1 holin-like protein [Ureibacillus acetophenoni]
MKETLQTTIIRFVRTAVQIILLYGFHYIGVFIVTYTKIPLPPSVIGFILLFMCLLLNWVKVEYIRDGASFLISFMLIFYIPPLIGIIEYPELLSPTGVILFGAVIISTLFTLFITSFLGQKIEKREELFKNKSTKLEMRKELEIEEALEGDEESERSTINH